ncbi:MAG: hypothetical protein WDN47_01390 [Candidatus Doudnabacteria bacterium]
MRNTLRLFAAALVCAGLPMTGACNHSSPTSPSTQTPPPADAHSVPIPGTTQTFYWWISAINPGRYAQLVMGQPYDIELRCSAPDGYRFLILTAFTNGPDTPPIAGAIGTGTEGGTNQCAYTLGMGGANGTVNAATPNLPYFRYSVWLKPGNDPFLGPGTPRPTADPAIVNDEQIGWQRPQ